jgi:hypothetical protein
MSVKVQNIYLFNIPKLPVGTPYRSEEGGLQERTIFVASYTVASPYQWP